MTGRRKCKNKSLDPDAGRARRWNAYQTDLSRAEDEAQRLAADTAFIRSLLNMRSNREIKDQLAAGVRQSLSPWIIRLQSNGPAV